MKVRHYTVNTILLFILCSFVAYARARQDVSTAQADSIIRTTKGIIILDVRTPEEYRLGHLANSTLIDYYDSKFYNSVNTLPKESTILVYCRSGRRSAEALEILKNLRYPRVYNMLGGIDAWKKERRNVVRGK